MWRAISFSPTHPTCDCFGVLACEMATWGCASALAYAPTLLHRHLSHGRRRGVVLRYVYVPGEQGRLLGTLDPDPRNHPDKPDWWV